MSEQPIVSTSPSRSAPAVEPRTASEHRAEIGRLGEDFAVQFLTAAGWRIVERNWRCRHGELDIIATDGAVLVFVEVKTRTTRMYADPAAAVTPTKLARMRKLSLLWLSEQERGFGQIRFDVVSVRLDRSAPHDADRAAVSHHVGVFA